MHKGKPSKHKLSCTRNCSREMNPIPVGNLKPHNCKTPCPYGNGTTFCFPCMAKIMNEHNALRKAG